MQSAWKGRGRRKNRESRLSGNDMRGNMVSVINWKTFTFESEEFGVDMIPKAILPERSWTNWRVSTQSVPTIVNFEAEKVSPNDQSYVRQDRLSSALPTKTGTGQNRNQCCTELSLSALHG